MYPTMPILLLLLSQFPVTVPLLRIIWLLGIWFGPVPSHYILSVFIPPRSAPPPTNIRSDQIRTRTRTGTRAREHGNEQAQCFEKKKRKGKEKAPKTIYNNWSRGYGSQLKNGFFFPRGL